MRKKSKLLRLLRRDKTKDTWKAFCLNNRLGRNSGNPNIGLVQLLNIRYSSYGMSVTNVSDFVRGIVS